MARVLESALAWLAGHAGAYCGWYDRRVAKRAPKCPDCRAPEPWCYCDEMDHRRDEADGAYDAGIDAGYEMAVRDYRGGAEW